MGKTLRIKRLQASKTQHKNSVPEWVIVMCNTVYFRKCSAHVNVKKNELDRFCIDCLRSFCSHCLPSHALHNHVKIRRYIYSDVINRQDLCKLFNCSGIQTYHTNKAKVLFLKQRAKVLFLKQRTTHHHHHHQQQQQQQQQHSSTRDYCCTICDKSLQDNSLYCSIACKVLDIFGDDDHRGEEDSYKEDEEASFVRRLPLTKKRRLSHSRKGVPLRAPMF